MEGFWFIFSVLGFIAVVFLLRFGLKSGQLKMQILQRRSAQIKKLKKTNQLKNLYIEVQTKYEISPSPTVQTISWYYLINNIYRYL